MMKSRLAKWASIGTFGFASILGVAYCDYRSYVNGVGIYKGQASTISIFHFEGPVIASEEAEMIKIWEIGKLEKELELYNFFIGKKYIAEDDVITILRLLEDTGKVSCPDKGFEEFMTFMRPFLIFDRLEEYVKTKMIENGMPARGRIEVGWAVDREMSEYKHRTRNGANLGYENTGLLNDHDKEMICRAEEERKKISEKLNKSQDNLRRFEPWADVCRIFWDVTAYTDCNDMTETVLDKAITKTQKALEDARKRDYTGLGVHRHERTNEIEKRKAREALEQREKAEREAYQRENQAPRSPHGGH